MPKKYDDKKIIDVLVTWREEACTYRSISKKKNLNVKTIKKIIQLYDLDEEGILIHCSDQ